MGTPLAFHRLAGLAAAVLAMGTLVVAPSAQAADLKSPRIRSVIALDANANDKIDGFHLSYNEAIRHPLDEDGTYPFSIVGYQLTAIEAASGKTLVVRVTELASPDISASPIVAYKTGISAPVRDRAGNKAKSQSFSRVVPLDVDGDGATAVGGDCAPADPGVGPSAADQPDLALIDANCDGMDGDPTKAVFVSTTGSDSDAGTPAMPKLTIGAGLTTALAAHPAKDVYVATGTYDVGSGLTLSSGAHIFGGYDSTDWSRSVGTGTVVAGAPVGIVAISANAIELQNLRVAASSAPGSDGEYAAFLRNSSAVFAGVTLEAAAGESGLDGSSTATPAAAGGDGAPGAPGVEHSAALFCNLHPLPDGGAGGTLAGVPAAAGGAGGAPGVGYGAGKPGIAAAAGTAPGAGVPSGYSLPEIGPEYMGADGANGTDGSSGLAGAASFTSSGFIPGDGAPGGPGQPGAGGGGGGGGGGGTVGCDSSGSSGGGGGAGGAGGIGGGGGSGGASSIALYLESSSADVTADSVLIAGDGGTGGDGGAGQPGGAGGSYGPAGSYGGGGEQDDGTSGGHGGTGGAGGIGGPGAGGAGGSSICVLVGGASVVTLDPSTSLATGTAGAGGGGPGAHGAQGVAVQTLSL